MKGETHVPFLVFGTLALLGSGIANDSGASGTGAAFALIGVFMFACNVALFFRSNPHDNG